ncbi:MAG: hypothetical protein Q9183_001821 [Haloplaca sp. 2 TL-2023]
MRHIEDAKEPNVAADFGEDDDVINVNSDQVQRHSAYRAKKLVNPFTGKTHGEMNDLIDAFMERSRIDEIYAEHIRKGAFLAQDGEAFDDVREDGLQLKEDERNFLNLENPKSGHKWNQPWILYALVGCCSLGAAVQGWDEVSLILT